MDAVIYNELKKSKSAFFGTAGTYSWTVPDGVYSVRLTGIGGGGGAGGSYVTAGLGTAGTAGGSYVTAGLGIAGTAGGITSFGSILSLIGGGGGNPGSTTIGGSAGLISSSGSIGMSYNQGTAGTNNPLSPILGGTGWLGYGTGGQTGYNIGNGLYAGGSGASGLFVQNYCVPVTPGTVMTIKVASVDGKLTPADAANIKAAALNQV
jgi:hypothetical protein